MEGESVNMGEMIVPKVRTCSEKVKKFAVKKFPIIGWLPKYKKSYIISDLLAGITVWLTAVPQSMAYAVIAGLSPEYGLYSQLLGPFIYIFLGSCRQVIIGPTSVIELVSYQTCGEKFPACVTLLGFYAGVVELILGFLHLGFLVSLLSEPTVVGFTAGASVTVMSVQIKNLLGLKGRAKGSGFYSTWRFIFENIHTLKLADSVMGILCIIFLLMFQKLKDIKLPSRVTDPARWKKILTNVTLARNALVVIMCSILAFFWEDAPFNLTGKVQSGFPPVAVPTFNLIDPHSNSTEPMSFIETVGFLGTSPLSVAMISILQNVAITKAFGLGQTIDGTQEMITLGVTNLIGGFFSCLPTSGSFSRSAINDASGVKSQLGSLFVGILILLSLSFLTPAFQYIPKASLAAVVTCAVLFMIEVDTILLIWKTSKIDFSCCLVTFVVSLIFGMELGICVGVFMSCLIILLKSIKPSTSPELLVHPETKVKYVLLRPNQGLYFPSIDHIRDTVNKLASRYSTHSVIVIQSDKWTMWDFSSLNAMVYLAKNLQKNGKILVFYKNTQAWSDILNSFGAQPSPIICCPHESHLDEFFRARSVNPSPTEHSLESVVQNNSNHIQSRSDTDVRVT